MGGHPDWMCPDIVWVSWYLGSPLELSTEVVRKGGLGIHGRRVWLGDLWVVLGRLGGIIVVGRRGLAILILFGRRRGRRRREIQSAGAPL
jgi:hypothetical protein